MELGIFSKTYAGNLEQVFAQMHRDHIYVMQLNLLSAGMETMPEDYRAQDLDRIAALAKRYQIRLAALSGTFNMIDPDLVQRKEGIRRFAVLCEIASYLHIPIITLCSGSKNKESKWKWDDENAGKEAWNDLLATTEAILKDAVTHRIILGVEPEASNVVNTPEKARAYLDTFHSPYLKIVMDGANLFHTQQIHAMQETLRHAFALLGKDICLAHAKDLGHTDEICFVAAGQGILDFALYLELLRQYHYDDALIMHGLADDQVQESAAFLKELMTCHPSR